MSPEQAIAGELDNRTDLFSLGGTLHTLCTGQPPFDADRVVLLLRQVCDQPHVSLRIRNSTAGGWLADFIDRLLEKEPKNRLQTAAEVERLLDATCYICNVLRLLSAASQDDGDRNNAAHQALMQILDDGEPMD